MTEFFTLEGVNQAVAAAVTAALPGVTVYDDPRQQGTTLPALFITYAGEQEMCQQVGGRWLARVSLALRYLERKNLPDLGQRYRRAAQALDEGLALLPFPGGRPLRPVARRWSVEEGALCYRLELALRLSVLEPEVVMGREVTQIRLKGG